MEGLANQSLLYLTMNYLNIVYQHHFANLNQWNNQNLALKNNLIHNWDFHINK